MRPAALAATVFLGAGGLTLSLATAGTAGNDSERESGGPLRLEGVRVDGVQVLVRGAVEREGLVCLGREREAWAAIEAVGGGEGCDRFIDGGEGGAGLHRPLSDGAEVTVLPVPGGCRVRVGLLPAARRLLLGVRLDLNRASREELEAVPGIGPSTAAAIVARRNEVGPYRSLADLRAIRGIGPARIRLMEQYLEVR